VMIKAPILIVSDERPESSFVMMTFRLSSGMAGLQSVSCNWGGPPRDGRPHASPGTRTMLQRNAQPVARGR
jgi:hypothetical protein